jgi:hypothetical protein
MWKIKHNWAVIILKESEQNVYFILMSLIICFRHVIPIMSTQIIQYFPTVCYFCFCFSFLLGILKEITDEYVVRLKVNQHSKWLILGDS